MPLTRAFAEADSPFELSSAEVVWTGLVAVLALGAVAVVLTAVVLLLRSSRGGRESAGKSTEDRLAEIDELAERGRITEAEREKARARILGSL
ncbi:hypothetical protein [Cellulomonas sp. PhB143]|uniref:hypothetical protein n=1 Tax=Cellulomonas sp. PhB143 TaxID=2485186 RepID=UPI000F4A5BD8|nr:hypothetical protein [Cellulomonas sp. PhB143]ROS72059.1 hypothetical protein EDF32_2803 [Cellulomonas sp. PhB143]